MNYYPELRDGDWLRSMYRECSGAEIAKALGASEAAVFGALQRHGIPRRPNNKAESAHAVRLREAIIRGPGRWAAFSAEEVSVISYALHRENQGENPRTAWRGDDYWLRRSLQREAAIESARRRSPSCVSIREAGGSS